MSTFRISVIGFGLAGFMALSVPAQAGSGKVIYAFKGENDGANPVAGVIMVHGVLYGTTANGGSNDGGALFSVTTHGAETVLHSFYQDFPKSDLTYASGKIYGTTFLGGATADGSVFSFAPGGAEQTTFSFNGTDGYGPVAGLLKLHGTLYGTTSEGGAQNLGTVYALTEAGTETVLYSFKGGSDGSIPAGNLINVGGTLYGTTQSGGGSSCNGYGCGTVFAITPAGAEKVLYSFKGGNDGGAPVAGLVKVGGTLYGTTEGGGGSARQCPYNLPPGCGTVFSVTPAGVEKVVYAFQNGNDGADPEAGLVNVGGTLYGTTYESANSRGTVFSVTPAGVEKVVYGFTQPNDGSNPAADLIYAHGKLYGTTYNGGANQFGTVFEVTP